MVAVFPIPVVPDSPFGAFGGLTALRDGAPAQRKYQMAYGHKGAWRLCPAALPAAQKLLGLQQ